VHLSGYNNNVLEKLFKNIDDGEAWNYEETCIGGNCGGNLI